MNTSIDNTLFHAQHKNKCYCQNGNFCYCIGKEQSSRSSKGTSHKFIKINSGKMKQNKSRSLSGSSSFSPTQTHMNSLSISSFSSSSGVSSSFDPKLTERRETYERSKLEKGDLNSRLNMGMWNVQEHILFSRAENFDLFNDDRIEKLQEFRLRNADQCLSAGKRFSIDKTKLKGSSEETLQETKYTLSKRGLLKPVGSNDDSKAAIVCSKSAIRDILRQKLSSTKNKDEFIRKTLCFPEKSLALRYQQNI